MNHPRTRLIVNPSAGSSDLVAQLESDASAALGPLERRETTSPGDAARLAREAVDEGCECIVAAGGDGTVNEVVNGVAPDFERVVIGVLPLGTGNDLVGSLHLSGDPEQALIDLAAGREAPVDLLRVEVDATVRYGVNALTAGFSAKVDDALEARTKELLGRLAFLVSAGITLPELEPYEVTLISRDGGEERIDAYNVIVCNGKTLGGGIPAAPDTVLDDGLADLIVIPVLPVAALSRAIRALVDPEVGHSEELLHRQVPCVMISASPPMGITLDGEIVEQTPCRVEVVRHAARFFVGRDYRTS